MTNDFWLTLWAENSGSFNQATVNTRLVSFFGELGLHGGDRVFVPLSGRTIDMIWLAEQGMRVIGVELSEIPVKAFFEDNELHAEVTQDGPFTRYSSEAIDILCGDFFALRDSDLTGIAAVYDRAALIALPPDVRVRYARRLAELLRPGARMLLLTLEYPQEQIGGPPFSVPEQEVRELYGGDFSIELLAHNEVPITNARFRDIGIENVGEGVYLLVRK